MDLPVELIFFLILIVANAIAGLFGGKKKGGPRGTTLPPVERKRPAAERQRPAPAPARSSRPQASEKPWWESDPEPSPEPAQSDPWRDDPARPAGPVLRSPEDLWEILTGERLGVPGPEPTPPAPAPGPAPRFPGGRPSGYSDPRAPRPEPAGDADVVSLEGDSLEGRSLEETEISDVLRHEEFHRKIGRAPVVAKRQAARERLGIASLSDVRRAVVLTEVLGPPRSLSGPDR